METSPTPIIENVATPETEPINQSNGTAPTGSDAPKVEQTAPAEDTFTSVDVKSLTPELKSKYDAMLTDYKKKTTEAAEIRKSSEAKLKQVEDYIQNPEFQRVYQSLNSAQKAEVRQDTGITEEEFNRAFENKENFAGFVQKVAKISSAQSQQEVTDLKASLMVKDFRQTHPDFEKLNKYQFITKQLQTDPRAHGNDANQWNQALNDAYSNAQRVYNEIVEEGKRQGMERIQQKVAQSTEPPTNTPSSVNPFGDPKNWTTAQAIAAARQGYRVPAN
jgi:hypothetical protein